MDLEGISEKMSAKVRADARVNELPIYAQVSIRTSVMGILKYLEKNP